MNVEHEEVGETHTDPTGEMTNLTYIDDTKITRHAKTRYSIEGGQKIPADMVDFLHGMHGREKSGY